MALSALIEWEVRTTGSATNGGGFKAGASGTDYSQQDAAQWSVTDAVGNGTTTVTSATASFTSAIVGNVAYIQSQWYEVTGYTNATTITVDKATGTFTGGTLKVGGALDRPNRVAGVVVSGQVFHIKAGTYTLTASGDWDMSSFANGVYQYIGYSATHLDFGTKPVITSATNSVKLMQLAGSAKHVVSNLKFTHTAATRGPGIASAGSGVYPLMVASDCVFDGCSYGILGDNSIVGAAGIGAVNCEIKNCTAGGIDGWFGITVIDCFIHDNTGTAIKEESLYPVVVVHCQIHNNTGSAIHTLETFSVQQLSVILNNSISGNGSDAIKFGLTQVEALIQNNIIYGTTGYGILGINSTNPSVVGEVLQKYNAFGSNSSGNTQYRNAGRSNITLSASPFTGSPDFSLNNTAGAGASCRNAGYQYPMP